MEVMQAFLDFNKSVSELVRHDYRTSDVFKKYGINFCCGGQLSLQEACMQKSIDQELLLNELKEATRTIHISNALPFAQWPLGFLIDYIIHVHHAYQKMALPSIESSLTAFVEGHKNKFPGLKELAQYFHQLAAIILPHNLQEEEIIFPYIRQIENTYRRKEIYGNLFVRTLRKPLAGTDAAHTEISAILKQIQTHTHNYTCPVNACTNHQVVFAKLREFHEDMEQHNHLENTILFPRAIEMESELLQL